jgi:excisionase family DNA binding protein
LEVLLPRKRNAKVADAAKSEVQPRMFNVKEAAAYLGSTVYFVRTLVWERRLPKVKFGKRLVFDRADLDEFIEKEKRNAL